MHGTLTVAHAELAASLIAAAKSGSDYAFARLVRLYQSRLRAFLRRLTGADHARADDLAQQTFLKAHQTINSYAATGSFAGWLFQIAYREFLDEERKKTRRQRIDEAQSLALHEAVVPTADLRLDMATALARLKPEERAAITLCLSEGMSHPEAAHVLDMPIGTVKSHIARGREKLKASLQIWRAERSIK